MKCLHVARKFISVARKFISVARNFFSVARNFHYLARIQIISNIFVGNLLSFKIILYLCNQVLADGRKRRKLKASP